MKKKIILFFVLAALLSLSAVSVLGVSAADAAREWTLDGEQSGVTITDNNNYKLVSGQADSAVKLKLSGTVDADAGFYFQYMIPSVTNFDIGENARKDGSNYIKTTVTKGDKKIEIISYALYKRADSAAKQLAKMQHDVFYYDPTIKREGKNNNVKDGVLYLETFETYLNVEEQRHTVDFHKENGMWFIAIDGLTTIPTKKLNDLDLNGASVSFEMYSKAVAPQFRIYPATNGVNKTFITDGYVQFGSDEIDKLGDDTTRFRVKDKRADQYPGGEIRYREQLISAVGYDVKKPINIEFSYDVSNASAVWYAVGLGRPTVYEDITRLCYDVFNYGGKGVDNLLTSYGDNIAAKNDGIMFQTTTGLAQPTNRDQNSRLADYLTNSASKPYSGRGNMDLITFIVGENGTDMYHNGALLFDGLATKLSDFEASNYMAYPYFHFFEDSANSSKGNTIVIKGVNAARRTDDKELKITGGTNTDLSVGIDNIDNGDITLYDYSDGVFTAVDSSLYTYDAEAKLLTVKYAYFDGKAYDVYKLYARNNSGSEEIEVRFSDPTLATLPPVPEKDTFYWKTGAGTEDLVVKVDIKNGIFKSFSGSGITATNWKMEPIEGTTEVTITINKDFLNLKKAQTCTFTVRTTNVEEEDFTGTFKVIINAAGAPGDDDNGNGGNGGEGGGNGETGGGKVGCGGAVTAAGVTGGAIAAIAAAGAMFFVLRKKKRA